jgi:hypothetical protein
MTEESPSPSPAAFEQLRRERRRSARQLTIEGVPWLVYEMPASRFDRRSAPSLIFESEDTIRRVRIFPEDWRQMSDEELITLSWRR